MYLGRRMTFVKFKNEGNYSTVFFNTNPFPERRFSLEIIMIFRPTSSFSSVAFRSEWCTGRNGEKGKRTGITKNTKDEKI